MPEHGPRRHPLCLWSRRILPSSIPMDAENTNEIILTVFFRDVLTSYESGIFTFRGSSTSLTIRAITTTNERIITKIWCDIHPTGARRHYRNIERRGFSLCAGSGRAGSRFTYEEKGQVGFYSVILRYGNHWAKKNRKTFPGIFGPWSRRRLENAFYHSIA